MFLERENSIGYVHLRFYLFKLHLNNFATKLLNCCCCQLVVNLLLKCSEGARERNTIRSLTFYLFKLHLNNFATKLLNCCQFVVNLLSNCCQIVAVKIRNNERARAEHGNATRLTHGDVAI